MVLLVYDDQLYILPTKKNNSFLMKKVVSIWQPLQLIVFLRPFILKERGGGVMATIVTTLSERRRMKRWEFERGVLQSITLEELKHCAEAIFHNIVPFYFKTHPFLLDPCLDMGIDAYLIGAEYSRFGYLGESEERVYRRCEDELTELTYSLYTLLQGWIEEDTFVVESLHVASITFINTWWRKGFNEGKRRHRLKL